ncbi:hypothetical protein SESBI_37191 [Sesbania bispinosa]|nr:hypothetical protein SESBI_37191 [Sesbania bispinosa]
MGKRTEQQKTSKAKKISRKPTKNRAYIIYLTDAIKKISKEEPRLREELFPYGSVSRFGVEIQRNERVELGDGTPVRREEKGNMRIGIWGHVHCWGKWGKSWSPAGRFLCFEENEVLKIVTKCFLL